MKFSEGWVDEAPSAMPSAAEWMIRPMVVERGRERRWEDEGGSWVVEGAERSERE